MEGKRYGPCAVVSTHASPHPAQARAGHHREAAPEGPQINSHALDGVVGGLSSLETCMMMEHQRGSSAWRTMITHITVICICARATRYSSVAERSRREASYGLPRSPLLHSGADARAPGEGGVLGGRRTMPLAFPACVGVLRGPGTDVPGAQGGTCGPTRGERHGRRAGAGPCASDGTSLTLVAPLLALCRASRLVETPGDAGSFARSSRGNRHVCARCTPALIGSLHP